MLMKYEGWPCSKVEMELLEQHGKTALGTWKGDVHPCDHVIAICAGWHADQETVGAYYRETAPGGARACVVSAGGRSRTWRYRRRADGRQITCTTIVSAMARAFHDVRAAKEIPF